MTTQISDSVAFKETIFTLCGCNGNELFDPMAYGLLPAAPSTACYRGWMAEFAVEEYLQLKDLYVFHDAGLAVKNRRPNGPVINSILPIEPNSWCGFNCLYKNLNLLIPFTGGLLLGNGYIKQIGSNMGYHPFWKYESVVELIFDNGHLKSVENRSAVALAVREKHLASGILGHKKIVDDAKVAEWIEQSFSMNYSLAANSRSR